MKARFLMGFACFLTLLSCAHAANKFDITLEGPWLLYPYKLPASSASGAATTTVLIAVAPLTDATGTFHRPIVSAGDGYIIPREGIFCLTFTESAAGGSTDTCAPQAGSTLTLANGYPSTGLLNLQFRPVKVGQTYWDLISVKGLHPLYALVLPMPNSYSTDGAWNIEFAEAWHLDETGYGQEGNGDKPYSIGVHLYYNTGPTRFNLKECTTSLDVQHCNGSVNVDGRDHTTIRNTGTLRIFMKAPEPSDACDYHVRKIYHPMLRLLDGTDFVPPAATPPTTTTPNVNQEFGYIDPARSVDDSGHGYYHDSISPNCYKNDPQQNDSVQNATISTSSMSMKSAAGQAEALPTESTLSTELQSAQNLVNSLGLTDDQKKYFNEESAYLEKTGAFPRLSELSSIAEFLNSAAAIASDLNKRDVAGALQKIATDVEGKNGADCRAPIVLVTGPATATPPSRPRP